jgi:hypothetical protein
MNKFRFTFNALAVLVFALAFASAAQAQATRTWVSGVGDDVNPCSRTAPCKTFAGAISKTAKDGEISVLDPGGFGAITIVKSITINGGGTGQGYGSILAAGVNGVVINITDVNDIRKTVRLNHLDINGASTGLDGVRFLNGLELHIENTNIDGFTGDGVEVNLASAQTTLVHMRNVVIRNCVGAGIKTFATGATGQTAFGYENLHISRNGTGIDAQNGTRGTMRSSLVSLNGIGIAATEVGGSNTEFNVDSSTFTGHSVALQAGAGTVIRIRLCLVSQNTTSLTGTVDTGANNTIMGNTNNTAPTGASFPPN